MNYYKMFRYKNPFFNKSSQTSKEIIETNEFPIEFKGYYIFHSQKGTKKEDNVFDIVKNDTLISQMVTIDSCKNHITKYLTN